MHKLLTCLVVVNKSLAIFVHQMNMINGYIGILYRRCVIRYNFCF